MRLWHKDLIDVLPNQMLVAQWRELSAIVGKINRVGSPNHRLVNLVLDYDKSEFWEYTNRIYKEMKKRKMKPSSEVYKKIANYCEFLNDKPTNLFEGWHNKRYLKQCYHNLEEKHDRGIVDDADWEKIENKYNSLRGEK